MLEISGQHVNWKRNARMFEVKNIEPRYLTIGIPTVRRNKTSYFFESLDSLLNSTTEKQTSEIIIVIFLADFNTTWKSDMFNKIQRRYPTLVKDNTIQVIQAYKDFYPPLDNLRHTFNDSEARTKWRSKQNVDYAFLWMYCAGLSKFYMQTEDDVLIVNGYIDIIKDFILQQKEDWWSLEFSQIGFIGKVFHSDHLEKLAKTILLFYDTQPVDFLFMYANYLNLQNHRIIRRPTIFRHIGYHSSLPGKVMEADDKYFDDDVKKVIKGDNPSAKLFTTLRISPDFPLEQSYLPTDGYFWAHSSPNANDTLHILFDKPQKLKRIVVLTGSRGHPNDILENARMEACLTVKLINANQIECFNTVSLGVFLNGTLAVDDVQKIIPNYQVICLKIIVNKSQRYWLIVKEIAVFIDDS